LAQPNLETLVLEYKKNESEEKLNEILVAIEPLIKYWCQSQCYIPWEREDLLQVARIAVLGALERFDPEKGIKFKTFAYKTVTGKILNYFRDSTWKVSIPRKYREMSTHIADTERNIYQKTGKAPDITEIAATLGVDKEEIQNAQEAKRIARTSSLSEVLDGEENKTEMGHFIGQEDGELQFIEFKQDLVNALAHLDERQRQVIYLRFFQDLTQSKVAQALGVSQMQVSRLERMALNSLKKHLALSQ
jgi:RNA polymerase sigma-B factor